MICLFALPVILSSCKENIDIEEIITPNFNQSVKPSDKDIEDFKNWYSQLDSNPNARVGAKDGIDEVQEIELWKRAKIHQQDKSSNKLMTLPLIDFKEKGKTKVKQLYLTEIDGKKEGYKVEINNSNGKSNKFTGTVTITSLDEKSKREYKYKDNKLESNKNARVADFGNQDLPEVTVTGYVNNGGTMLLVSLIFSPLNTMPYVLYDMVEPCGDWGCGYINFEHDPALVEATLDWIRDKLLQEFSKHLKPAEMDILRTMSTTDIVKFYNNFVQAHRITNAMFPNGQVTNDGGHANAFKHVLFSALHGKAFGFDLALQLTNAHENGEVGCNTIMDVANNNIGIILGASSNIDINTLANNIYQMAQNGQLWTLGGSGCIHQVPF